MKNDTLKRAAKVLNRKHRRRAWRRFVSVLAGIVVFCTTYALILPAITAELAPGTVEGVTPNGTVINVFDYWLTDRISQNTQGDWGEGNQLNSGINQGHALKFSMGDAEGGGNTNVWTHSEAPRYGLVEKTLGTDGYPKLTPTAVAQSDGGEYQAESLAYLFDPTIENEFKQTFRKVGGLLQIDKEGYYCYDSTKNYAELNEETRMFTLYDTWGVHRHPTYGQFFPFNQFAVSQGSESTASEINHYFGLTMTSRFVQRYGGHTNSSRNTDTIFEFAGDDDVWVFIDGVLIGDLGGIHNRATLKINFDTGQVYINGVETTTLKKAFEDAGKVTTADEWKPDSNTFADNTYHTLKFFYLERGNYDSNMMLKYNLTAVPATSIYKVDQYGQLLKDVEFKVYRTEGETWGYDENNPVYTGRTDKTGVLTFVDDDDMPYTLKELQELFGEHCVMKETSAPDGYRRVNTEVRLHINDKALWCENTYESGVWAMVTLRVSAPTELQLVKDPDNPVAFYEFNNKEKPINGTLFGIVVKRMGEGDISKLDSWAPVSGNSKDGFTVYQVNGNTQAEREKNFVETAITIAQEKQTFFKMEPSGAMELTMTNLPGHVMEYYYMLGADQKPDAKFTTAYYWTSADSLDGATAENTFRVNSDAAAPDAFDRIFGASIEVPNLSNRLIAQKYDKAGNLVNGAIFALFRAYEDGTYIGKYTKEDGTEAEIGVSLEGRDYTTEVYFDSSNDQESYAIIRTVVDGKEVTITSVEQRRTNSTVLKDTPGTCVFGIRDKPLVAGCYYLREVQAPPGYKINTTPVMVRVTEHAIYANAGIEGDGVKVARGPGYVVATLHKAASMGEVDETLQHVASAGDVDNTLTWIYQQMVASEVSNKFEDALFVSGVGTWHYVKDGENIQTSYLYYDRTPQQLGENRFLANYEVDKIDKDRTVIPGTVAVDSLQLSTDVGWSFNTIHQDYAYGSKYLEKTGSSAAYTDLREKDPDGNLVTDEKGNFVDKNIYNLFSRSVYVRVTDEPIYSDLEISKEVTGTENRDAEFTFTVTVEAATGSYDYAIYDANDRNTVLGTGKITSGGTIALKGGQIAVIKDLPGLAKYTVTEMPVKSYNASYCIDGGEAVPGLEASGTLNWEGEDGNRISKVVFTNTFAPSLNLTLKKYAAGTTTPLSGAKFVLCTVVGESAYYYKDGAWVMLSGENTLESLARVTDANGQIQFADIPDGKYTLKEIAPPDGYHLPDKDAAFTVSGGEVVEGTGVEFDKTSVTVTNSTGHQLPETGGIGTKPFTIAGSVLTVGAGILLLYLTKKRRKENFVSF